MTGPEPATEPGELFAERLCEDYREVLLRRGWTPPERAAFFEVLGRTALQAAEDEGGLGIWLQ